MEPIIINGEEYAPIEQNPVKVSSKVGVLLGMAIMMGDMAFNGIDHRTPTPKKQIDIIKEYGLIQLKKSNLTASERNWVVWQFEKRYRKIDKPQTDGTI